MRPGDGGVGGREKEQEEEGGIGERDTYKGEVEEEAEVV